MGLGCFLLGLPFAYSSVQISIQVALPFGFHLSGSFVNRTPALPKSKTEPETENPATAGSSKEWTTQRVFAPFSCRKTQPTANPMKAPETETKVENTRCFWAIPGFSFPGVGLDFGGAGCSILAPVRILGCRVFRSGSVVHLGGCQIVPSLFQVGTAEWKRNRHRTPGRSLNGTENPSGKWNGRAADQRKANGNNHGNRNGRRNMPGCLSGHYKVFDLAFRL